MKSLFAIAAALLCTMAHTMEQGTQRTHNSSALPVKSIPEKRALALRALPIFVPYFAFMGGLCGYAAHTAGLTDRFSDPFNSITQGALLGSAAASVTISWLSDHI